MSGAAATLKEHLVTAVMTACALGAGGTIVAHEVALERQDERLSNIENLSEQLDSTKDELAKTRLILARIEGSLDERSAE